MDATIKVTDRGQLIIRLANGNSINSDAVGNPPFQAWLKGGKLVGEYHSVVTATVHAFADSNYYRKSL